MVPQKSLTIQSANTGDQGIMKYSTAKNDSVEMAEEADGEFQVVEEGVMKMVCRYFGS